MFFVRTEPASEDVGQVKLLKLNTVTLFILDRTTQPDQVLCDAVHVLQEGRAILGLVRSPFQRDEDLVVDGCGVGDPWGLVLVCDIIAACECLRQTKFKLDLLIVLATGTKQ